MPAIGGTFPQPVVPVPQVREIGLLYRHRVVAEEHAADSDIGQAQDVATEIGTFFESSVQYSHAGDGTIQRFLVAFGGEEIMLEQPRGVNRCGVEFQRNPFAIEDAHSIADYTAILFGYSQLRHFARRAANKFGRKFNRFGAACALFLVSAWRDGRTRAA